VKGGKSSQVQGSGLALVWDRFYRVGTEIDWPLRERDKFTDFPVGPRDDGIADCIAPAIGDATGQFPCRQILWAYRIKIAIIYAEVLSHKNEAVSRRWRFSQMFGGGERR